MTQLQPKIKLPFEKKKLERIQKRLGNKVILRLQKNKNLYNKLPKKSISFANSELEREIEYSRIRTVIKLQEQ